MKTLWALLLLPTLSFGQVIVRNVDINKLTEVEYIEVIIDRRMLQNRQVFAVIDYGQVMPLGTFRDNRIRDDDGKDRRFNSEVEVFNFLHQNGWKHETTSVADEGIYHLLRRKSKTEMADK